jgi:SAM-dependent methyltransferase
MPPSEPSPWDVAGVAERIEEYWRSSPVEHAHVAALGDLCARYLTSRDLEIVEVGCGTGRIYEQIVPRLLPERGYTGIDLSARMLGLAHRRWPAGRFVRSDGCELALADDAVDYALAFEVVGHLPDVGRLLAELGRVARSGFLLTAWPATEEEGIADTHEHIGASVFLHRRFPPSRLVARIAAALPGLALEIEIAAVDSATWAYIVHRRAGPPGVVISGSPPAPHPGSPPAGRC